MKSRKIKLTDTKMPKIDPEKIGKALGAEYVGKVNGPGDGLRLYMERQNFIFLQEIVKKAAECKHADDACSLVYYINNRVGAPEPAWRNWHCDKHNCGGAGSIPKCSECERNLL